MAESIKKQQSFKNKEKQDKERYEMVIRNIQRKTVKLSKILLSLMKFVLFKKNKYFSKTFSLKQCRDY